MAQNQTRRGNSQQGNNQSQKQYLKESDINKQPVENAINGIWESYSKTASHNGLSPEEELAFLWAIFTSNLNLLERASNEPVQLQRALLTQASVGLSFDPSQQLSYLVVRKGKLIYDVGYRGLIKLAVDDGLITRANAELVYKKDQFTYRGTDQTPIHTNDTDFFGDRGPIVGGYVTAYLPDGGVMVVTMKESEFVEIASLNPNSDAWKKEFSKGEMRKKTVLKRGAKWWYNSAVVNGKDTTKIQSVIDYLNEDAGEGINFNQHDEARSSASTETKAPVEEPIPDDETITKKVQNTVNELIKRAKENKGWKTAEDYLKQKYQGSELIWAMHKLKQAISASEPEPTAN